MAAAIDAAVSANAAAQERRLNAIERLWREALFMRDLVNPIIFFYQMFTPDLYEQGSRLSQIPQPDEFGLSIAQRENLGDVRPWVSPKLWVLFFVHSSPRDWASL
jgi:hypothetical protein